jgi:signal transduction histidine kinase/CheY-like chemotaxis protein
VKVTVFVLLLLLLTLSLLGVCLSAATTTDPRVIGTLGLVTGLYGIALIVLIITKNSRVAVILGHMIILCMSLYTASESFTHGLQVISPLDGTPVPYAAQNSFSVVALSALIFRRRKIVLLYYLFTVALLLSSMLSAKARFSGEFDDPTLADNFNNTMVSLSVVAFCVAYYSDVSLALAETADLAQERMTAAKRDAHAERRANAAKSRFVAVMSHEIRNPLQATLLQLEMLESTSLSPKQRDYVSGIARSSNVVLSIVNGVLDVTKIESGAISLEHVPFSLREVVEFTLYTNEPKAQKKGVTLVSVVAPDAPVAVCGDPTRLRQILHNLVSNALKFTNDGEVEVTVTVAEERRALDRPGTPVTQRLWQFDVRDTGIGIDAAGQSKLFREFSQVDDSTTRMYGGTGLGLFICKELSHLMGGDVSVTSKPGFGSTFTVTIALDVNEEEAGIIDQPVRIVSTDVSWRVLVITPSTAVGKMLRMYLEYFFGVASVKIDVSHEVGAALPEVRSLIHEACPTRHVLVIAYLPFLTNGLTQLLVTSASEYFHLVALSPDKGAAHATQIRQIGWEHLVQTPVALLPLCATLNRVVQGKPAPDEEKAAPMMAGAALLGTSPDYTMNSVSSISEGSRKASAQGNSGTLSRGTTIPSPEQLAASQNATATASPDLPLVLIVEDFELVRALVQQVVASLGYNTVIATNGKEAVDLVYERYAEIAIVLMDCEMPIMDGFTATKEIRRYEAGMPAAPAQPLFVCAMTANAMRDDVKRCYEIGMSGFLSKPVRRADLASVLETNVRATPVAAVSPRQPPSRTSSPSPLTTSRSSKKKKRSKARVDDMV